MASIPLLRFSLSSVPTKPLFPTSPSPLSTRLPHPLKVKPLSKPPTFPSLRIRRRCQPQPQMSYTPTPATDRLISATAYLLPFFNGIQYGRHLFTQYPVLATVFQPIIPFLSLYRSVPYGSFVAFFALYLAVVRNPSFDRYVRFNAMQAVVFDVLLALPMLVERIFSPGRAGLGYRMLVMGHNAVFMFVVFCFVYSFISCILGKTPYLPFVADAAGRQL